ncbi:hypothetical protein [Actinomadura sp. DC4]|uniref:hypothetical protein n=1 Tax=Actinomadura sp. DC4 TaxID=3055069 RepID=UPI0025B20861|nr:hypothetical protein [Actinomadura sp. DC4]MDN3356801.1 hypothetical protein [Actinomadura sp. DC4]
MDLKDAAHMVLVESAPYAELRSVAQAVYDDFSAGQEVPYIALLGMVTEASRKGVLRTLRRKHTDQAFDEMVVALLHETDRQRTIAGDLPVRLSARS